MLLWVQNFISAALEPTKEEWFTVNKYLVDKGAALPEDWYVLLKTYLLTFIVLFVCINSFLSIFLRASMSGEETITPLDYNVLNPSSDPDKTYLEYLVRTNQVKKPNI